MLQVTQTSDVTRSNVGVEKEFNIKRTSKAFQILSSGLYSNKILAIVRELSCNAWDAHVAAAKTLCQSKSNCQLTLTTRST